MLAVVFITIHPLTFLLLLLQVQNADDNKYPEHVEPTLTFILQKTGIVVLNNECGFTPENIQALCDVGRSTKKGSGGYIGKKGIGFKSVFRVCAKKIHCIDYDFILYVNATMEPKLK